MNVNISGSASVFSKRDRFYPVTNVAAGFSHNNVTISGGKVYGQNVPSGWTGSCGAYLHFFMMPTAAREALLIQSNGPPV
jgi:hypothetical protein